MGACKAGSDHELGSPGLLQRLWDGVCAVQRVARNGGRATGRISSRKRNSVSTNTSFSSAAVQCGAAARCCRRNGRVAQPQIGPARGAKTSSSAPDCATRYLQRARRAQPPRPAHRRARNLQASRCALRLSGNGQVKECDLRRRQPVPAGRWRARALRSNACPRRCRQ